MRSLDDLTLKSIILGSPCLRYLILSEFLAHVKPQSQTISHLSTHKLFVLPDRFCGFQQYRV